ncbi:BON domain protein [Planctomycetes bacterium MalM25]|nr:BON domain protein [Planctomycetes bacterium MalM25]
MVTSRVVHQAEDCLGASSHLFLRHVECHEEEGALCLEGKVPSFYLKQTAQSLLQSLDGVDRIVNRLVVVNAYGVSSEPSGELPLSTKAMR